MSQTLIGYGSNVMSENMSICENDKENHIKMTEGSNNVSSLSNVMSIPGLNFNDYSIYNNANTPLYGGASAVSSIIPPPLSTSVVSFPFGNMNNINVDNANNNGGVSKRNNKPHLYKTSLCSQWKKNSTCHYGSKCQFAHGVNELRRKPANDGNSESKVPLQEIANPSNVNFGVNSNATNNITDMNTGLVSFVKQQQQQLGITSSDCFELGYVNRDTILKTYMNMNTNTNTNANTNMNTNTNANTNMNTNTNANTNTNTNTNVNKYPYYNDNANHFVQKFPSFFSPPSVSVPLSIPVSPLPLPLSLSLLNVDEDEQHQKQNEEIDFVPLSPSLSLPSPSLYCNQSFDNLCSRPFDLTKSTFPSSRHVVDNGEKDDTLHINYNGGFHGNYLHNNCRDNNDNKKDILSTNNVLNRNLLVDHVNEIKTNKPTSIKKSTLFDNNKRENKSIENVEKSKKRNKNITDNFVNNNYNVSFDNVYDGDNDKENIGHGINDNHEKKIKRINNQIKMIEKFLSQLQTKHKILTDMKENIIMMNKNNKHQL